MKKTMRSDNEWTLETTVSKRCASGECHDTSGSRSCLEGPLGLWDERIITNLAQEPEMRVLQT